MELLDEQGRLFGVVNIIDVLVVLVVLAVAAAGIALVFGSTESTADRPAGPERYATVTYTVPLGSGPATLSHRDLISGTYSTTDVTRSFAPNGDARITTKVAYRGGFEVETPLAVGGERTTLQTNGTRFDAEVTALNQTAATIPTSPVSVVLRTNKTARSTAAVTPGQQATIGDHTVATVVSKNRVERTERPDTTLIGLNLTARTQPHGQTFGGSLLRANNQLTVITEDTVLRGRIAAVGTTNVSDR
jgi:hypothetical protein